MSQAARGSGGWGKARHWDRRPVLAATLRVLAFLLPVLLAVAATILLGRVLPKPDHWWGVVLWWLAVLAGTVLVLVAADRFFRRMLPLAALYELSLVFPDRAPARFRMVRRGGSVAQLRGELEALSRHHDGRDANGPEAAQRVLTLVAALAVHDPRTRGHAERVRILTDMLAEEMHLPEHDRHLLRWAALLHDIGKLEVSADILRKPSPPDDAEWRELRRHPEEGDRLLGAVREWLGPWAPTVEHHHEHYDGSGYPHGLRGEEICLGGRIVALADAFEAMTARRPYTRPVSPGAAREELVRRAGTQFDPEVCRAFLSISLGRLWRVVGLAAGVAQVPLAAGLARFGGRVSPGVSGGGATVAVAGTLAAVIGVMPVVGIPNVTSTPHSAVAGLTTHHAGPAQPSPYPSIAPGVAIQAAPAPPPAPPTPAPVVLAVVRHSTSKPAVHSAPSSPAAVSVALTVHPGSVHKGTAYAIVGSLSSCAGCTVSVDWGDGSGTQSVALSGTSFVVDHTYAVKGRYLISVTVRVGSVVAGGTSRRVVVNNG